MFGGEHEGGEEKKNKSSMRSGPALLTSKIVDPSGGSLSGRGDTGKEKKKHAGEKGWGIVSKKKAGVEGKNCSLPLKDEGGGGPR